MKVINKLKTLLINIREKGFFHLLSSNFLTHFLTFFAQLLVASLLSAEDLGRIKVLQLYTEIAVLGAALGLPVAIVKYCSENRPDSQKIKILAYSLKRVISASLIGFIAIILLAYFNLLSPDPTVNQYFYLYGFLVIPMSVVLIETSYYQAKKLFKELSKIQIITKGLSFALIILLTYLFSIYGYIIAMILGFSATAFLLLYKLKIDFEGIKIDKREIPNLSSLANYSLITQVLNKSSNYINFLILNYFILDRNEFGQFSLALTLVQGLQIVIATIQNISTPYFAAASQNIFSWKKVFNKYNKIFILLNIITLLAAYFFGPILIKLIFANKYNESIVFFKILLVGWFFRSLYSLIGPAFIGLGKVNINLKNLIISLTISLPISIWIISNHGAMGAAYGSLIQSAIAAIVVWVSFVNFRRKNSLY